MAHFEPRSSSVLAVSRYTDVDEFRTSLRSAAVEVWPARAGPVSAMQAVLPLPDGEAYLLRTFARTVDIAVPANRLIIVLPLAEQPVSETVINGQLMTRTSLLLGRGPGHYHMLESDEGLGLALLLNARLSDRGWPPTGRMMVRFDAPEPALAALRWLVWRAFAIASYAPSQLASSAPRLALQDQLLAALDAAFAEVPSGDLMHALSFQTSLHIVDRIEEILQSELGRPIYSSELATRLHVSVRTINSAMSKIRGTSLHRYLRSRRLWSVRRQLLAGDATTQIKASALANGFWHLSEFSSQYVRTFGEHPSETLARALARRH